MQRRHYQIQYQIRPIGTVSALLLTLGFVAGCGGQNTGLNAVAESTQMPEAPLETTSEMGTTSEPESEPKSDAASTTASAATAETAAAPATSQAPAAVFAEAGIAIAGADPVAYFTQGAYVAGDAAYTYDWGGATWQFANAEHRDRFAQNPSQYAPQYGGFCAWAVSQGYTAPIDPTVWSIVDGKLYLNFDQSVQRRWERDIPGHIARADQNWPQVLTQ